jgi:hypothetical protein
VEDVQRVCSLKDEAEWTMLTVTEYERTGRLVPRDCQASLDTLERGYHTREEGHGCMSAAEVTRS